MKVCKVWHVSLCVLEKPHATVRMKEEEVSVIFALQSTELVNKNIIQSDGAYYYNLVQHTHIQRELTTKGVLFFQFFMFPFACFPLLQKK